MEQYSIFAKYYDEFMRDIPYDSWCEFILNELEKNNKKLGRILELGCGTGNMSFRMEKAGRFRCSRWQTVKKERIKAK